MPWRFVVVAGLCASIARAQDTPPIYYAIPGMERVQVVRNVVYKTTTVAGRSNQPLALDVYRSLEGATAPGVVFVHGGLSPTQAPTAKDWNSYQSWGRVAAASGMVAVVLNHRMNTNDNVREAGSDLMDAIAFVRTNAGQYGLDPNRLCVAFYSAGGPISSVLLRDTPPYLRCVVLYYPYLDLEHLREQTPFRSPYAAAYVDSLRDYSPRVALSRGAERLPPIFLARAGRDAIPYLNASVSRFMADAVSNNVMIDFVNHPTGAHGFDTRTRDDRTQAIIEQTIAFLRRHLR
jgi:acetyl esterase/lipase